MKDTPETPTYKERVRDILDKAITQAVNYVLEEEGGSPTAVIDAEAAITALNAETIGEDENDPNRNARWQTYRNELRVDLRHRFGVSDHE